MHGMLTWISDNSHPQVMQLDAIWNVLASNPMGQAAKSVSGLLAAQGVSSPYEMNALPDTATAGTAGAGAAPLTININAGAITEGPISINAPGSSAEDIRTAVVSGLQTNRNGFLENLTAAIKAAWPGVVTAPSPA